MIVRSSRWKLLLKQDTSLSSGFVLKALVIGYMINNILPAKVGELARMEYIKRKKGIGRVFLLGTIFLERFIDVLIVIVLFCISMLFVENNEIILFQNRWIILLISLFLIAAVISIFQSDRIKKIVLKLPAPVRGKIISLLDSFEKATGFVRNKNLLFSVTGLSLITWGLTLLNCFVISRGLNIDLPLHGYLFVIAAGVLGVVIPSTSGGLGVFHAITTGALILFDITPAKALAYSIIAHAFDFFPPIVLGLIILLRDT
jgi:hypothetical protein